MKFQCWLRYLINQTQNQTSIFTFLQIIHLPITYLLFSKHVYDICGCPRQLVHRRTIWGAPPWHTAYEVFQGFHGKSARTVPGTFGNWLVNFCIFCCNLILVLSERASSLGVGPNLHQHTLYLSPFYGVDRKTWETTKGNKLITTKW